MTVPRQQTIPARAGDDKASPQKGPRARTRRLMVDAASHLMRQGGSPSVSEVAEYAGVSRSTAYRYFPTEADMVRAVVGETLGPILAWQSEQTDARERVASLLRDSYPRLSKNAATFRAALRLSLESQSDTAGSQDHSSFARGHRVELLHRALLPLVGVCSDREIERLSQALSMIFGIEGIVALKDIWGLGGSDAEDVAVWAAKALVNAAIMESDGKRKET